MFRYFENLIDPFVAYEQVDKPPTRLWPFMLGYSQPFKRVFVMAALMSVVVAAVEVGLNIFFSEGDSGRAAVDDDGVAPAVGLTGGVECEALHGSHDRDE